jgi:ligand-binding sensor domain-containing protein
LKNLSQIVLFVLLLTPQISSAQYPHYFTYDDESGLPSNQVYSIVQDQKGFIWIGCDAGLYKFNGVEYKYYTCPSQTAKSVTGLTLSESGILYCYNFKSEIFYVENDSLKELTRETKSVTNLISDKDGFIYVSHLGGISSYNEKAETWTHFSKVFGSVAEDNYSFVSKSAEVNRVGEIVFLSRNEIGRIKDNQKVSFSNSEFVDFSPATYILVPVEEKTLIFSMERNEIFEFSNNKLSVYKNEVLRVALKDKKLTKAKVLADGNLWICTYKGLICFNYHENEVTILFPNISFSDCIIDREGHYWFTTLQSGIMRLTHLDWLIWNEDSESRTIEKLTNLCSDENQIYFATSNGQIGRLNYESDSVSLFSTGFNADIQSFDLINGLVMFNINNRLFSFENDQVVEIQNDISGIKVIFQNADFSVKGTNHGIYFNDSLIYDSWTREVKVDSVNMKIWAATNNGLVCFSLKNDKLNEPTLFLSNKQVVSFDLDKKGAAYAVSFDGELFKVSAAGEMFSLIRFPQQVQFNGIKVSDEKIYGATNKGVVVYDLVKQSGRLINTESGLISNNVQDLLVTNQRLYLATGKGLQRISIMEDLALPKALIYLKNWSEVSEPIVLNYNQNLILFPEVSLYSSMGNFTYAFRNVMETEKWTYLPSGIDRIELSGFDAGDFRIELKAIDHLGRDSENTLFIVGYVKPPFWKTYWFYAFGLAFIGILFFIVFKKLIAIRQRKMNQKMELNELKLTAIKSQMNPHFIFNVLSSIKGYIYENDRQKASQYLDDFSDLMRKVLEMSEIQFVTIEDELKVLGLYIDLEGMMLENFSYQMVIDENVQTKKWILPALLLQPYVENAFKHGLRHSQNQKLLLIKVSMTVPNELEFEISDNGIGRQESLKLNEQNTLKRKAFASDAIQRRIDLINSQGEQYIAVQISDLNLSGTENSGTKVQIKIRYLKND